MTWICGIDGCQAVRPGLTERIVKGEYIDELEQLKESQGEIIDDLYARIAKIEAARDILSEIAEHPANQRLPEYLREKIFAYFTAENASQQEPK